MGILQKYDKYLFQWAYDVQSSYTPSRNDSSIVLSYPKAHIYGHEIFLASHFFGAHLNHNFRNEVAADCFYNISLIIMFIISYNFIFMFNFYLLADVFVDEYSSIENR